MKKIIEIIVSVLILGVLAIGGSITSITLGLPRWTTALWLLCTVGFGGIIISKYFNRHIVRVNNKAKDIVLGRLLDREVLPVDRLLEGFNPSAEVRDQAIFIVSELANSIGVPVGVLRLDDSLETLFKVTKSEFSYNEWEKAGIDTYLYAFYDTLQAFFDRVIETEKWKKYWESRNVDPPNADEFMRLVLTKRLNDLILFLMPLLKQQKE